VSRVFFYSPHPDDETLSMGIAMLYYLAAGVETHLVSVTNGSAIGVANTLNGNTEGGTPVACTISDHPFIHNPAREGYPLVDPATRLSADDIGAHRNEEARSVLAMMSQIPPNVAGVNAYIEHHVENLPGDFAGSTSSSTSPVTQTGIDQAKTIIKRYVDEYPNSFHYTMSETDDHHDHAACGIALRQLKNDNVNHVPWDSTLTYAAALVNARFFVSKLYWENSYQNGQDVLTMPDLKWFPYGTRYNDYVAWLRNQVIPIYRAWSPAAGAYGIGYHQVASQFNNNFGPAATTANLWHA
jgi:LmbE family N-acetylglucosaminyl deacetylase